MPCKRRSTPRLAFISRPVQTHGCVLCEEDRPLIYMEDAGRYNAVDKIGGYMAHKDVGCRQNIVYEADR
jgi:FdhD protein